MTSPIRRSMPGNIAGGEVINIVPNRCSFAFEIRHLPQDDPERSRRESKARPEGSSAEAREVLAGADIESTPLASYPALDTPVDSEVVNFVHSLTGGNTTGKITFGTEGGLYQQRARRADGGVRPGHDRGRAQARRVCRGSEQLQRVRRDAGQAARPLCE